LLLKLFLFEVKGDDGWELKGVTHCNELSTIEAGDWKKALRLKHLRAFV
jgi:hypothetical protein